jgi:hypothetical protein
MAAQKFAPISATQMPRSYESPSHIPAPWSPGRPGEIDGKQPRGASLGNQGPDQGYILTLARIARNKIKVQAGESVDDAIRGSIGIALRRSSMYGRAPVMHDLTFALTIWGWLVDDVPADLLARRKELFSGVADTAHSYYEVREITGLVPETTYQLSIDQLTAITPMSWRALTGA